MNKCRMCGLPTSGIPEGGTCAECRVWEALFNVLADIAVATRAAEALAPGSLSYRRALVTLGEAKKAVSRAMVEVGAC